jgi:multiple sugar transport system substrate-binding protein
VRRAPAAALLVAAALAACVGAACRDRQDGDTVRLELWGLGREGEVARELIPEFERRHPGIQLSVQQIPWTAAHEKLLTAYVGESTPDVAQIGNTWVPEFAALRALLPLDERVAATPGFAPGDFFTGAWEMNRVDGRLWGIPWYVDTRVLFYRRDLLASAGVAEVPRTWSAWRRALERIRATGPPERYGVLLPTDEWSQPVIFALQKGSTILDAEGLHATFRAPPCRDAFAFYLGLYRDGLAPRLSTNQIANRYLQFAAGEFVFVITGPWDLGEYGRRLPPELADRWTTAPLPAPDDAASWPGVSFAGGSSLVVFRGSRHPEAAWKLVAFLSEPATQLRLFELAGDLPPRRSAWRRGGLERRPRLAAFYQQLGATVPTPRVPEWEQLAIAIQERSDAAIRGGVSLEATLAALDRDAERILAKRRALARRAREEAAP